MYCVQLHLGGKRVTRSLGTRDVEVAHHRAAQAMAELKAAHKAKQEGVTRWRDAKEFSSLLELADALDPQTAAEQYTGQRALDEASGEFLDTEHRGPRSSPVQTRGAGHLERSHPGGGAHPCKEELASPVFQLAPKCRDRHQAMSFRACSSHTGSDSRVD